MATVYTWPGNIPDADIDVDSPLTADLFADIRDGISNLAERLGTPGSYDADIEDHAHDGITSAEVDANNLAGELEPRAQAIGEAFWHPLGTAGERTVDMMDAQPRFGFLCGPGSTGDWYVFAEGMAGTYSRNVSTGALDASTAIYNQRFRGLSAERSNALYGDVPSALLALASNDREGNAHDWLSVVSYTGTGVARTVAHTLAGTPEFVFITRLTDAVNVRLWAKGRTYGSGPGGADDNTSVTGVGATNVTLGAGAEVNANGKAYIMLCVRTGGIGRERFGVLEWSGVTPFGNRTLTGLGFAPDWIFVAETSGANAWVVRAPLFPDDNSQNLNDGSLTASSILQITQDGIRVGANLNTTGESYVACCFKGVQRWG